MKLSLSRKALLIVILPLAFQLLFILILGCLLRQVEVEAQRLERSRAIVNEANILSKLTYDACTSLVAYNISKNRLFENSFSRSAEQIEQEMSLLKRLVNETPEQVEQINRVEKLMRKGLGLMMGSKRRADSSPVALDLLQTDKRIEMENTIKELVKEVDNLIQSEKNAEKSHPITEAIWRQAVEIATIVGIVLNIVIAVAMVAVFNRNVSTRLGALIDNTIRLARGDTLTPPLRGADELTQLDQNFRVMAGALAESTKQQTAVIENASDVICSIDNKNAFSHVSAAAKTVWGYEPDELAGKRVQEIILEDDIEQTMQAFARLAETEGTGNIESRVKHKDGRIVDTLWSVQWSKSEQSLFCVAHDRTQAKEAERLKQEFMEMVSHDIRTPLTSVTATLQMMEIGVHPENLEKDCRIARRNISQIIGLLNELLDVHKMESGKLYLDIESIDAKGLIAEAIDSVKAYADRENVKIDEPQSTALMSCDADRMRQVIVNLLSNAIKFSPKESTIKTAVEAAGDNVILSVIDSGPGVPEEFQEAIFDRFKQVQKSDATEKGGKGLGLYICKSIVQEHGGEIGVESHQGQGSRFWIRLTRATD